MTTSHKSQNRLRKEKKESLSKDIREALSHLTAKKEHSISVLPSFLPLSAKKHSRTVSSYFPQDEWNSLKIISKNTRTCEH